MTELPFVPPPPDEKEQNRKIVTQMLLLGVGVFFLLCIVPTCALIFFGSLGAIFGL